MYLYCGSVLIFVSDCDYCKFVEDEKVNFSCAFALVQIGELANKLSDELKNDCIEIRWRAVIGLRHRIVHDYEGVNLGRLWSIVTENIPELFQQLERILKKGVE